jgi:hypothetical protein
VCGPPEKEDILARMSAPRPFDPGSLLALRSVRCTTISFVLQAFSARTTEGRCSLHRGDGRAGVGVWGGTDAPRSVVKVLSRVLFVTLDQGYWGWDRIACGCTRIHTGHRQ